MKSIFVAAFLFSSLSILHARTYESDPAHSEATFKIRHLLSKVTGRFDNWTSKFTIDDKTGNLSSLEATAKTESINTNNEKRDSHLKSEDFFATDKFPEIKFVAEKINLKKGQKAKVTGPLTLHGITKNVTWDIQYLGTAKDPLGNDRAALTATLPKLNRKDFGLTWNKPLEKAGEMLIGDEVTVEVNVEALAAKNEAPAPSAATETPTTKADKKKK